jgi:peptide deformylase
MGILKVARIGHPAIRRGARPLTADELRSDALQRLVDDMVVTMKEYDGVGLAAPQVHLDLRIAVIEVPEGEGREAVPLTVLLNPELTPVGQETVDGWEGCLSIPDLRGITPRAKRVRVEALDRDLSPLAIDTEGFFARVLQHECDHLEGRVYLDRMRDLSTLTYLQELERHGPADEDDDE